MPLGDPARLGGAPPGRSGPRRAAEPCSAPLTPSRTPATTLDAVSDYLELLPAVDIADGQAVQLVQGVAGSEKRFGDPVEAALRWQHAGAEWIHLVDLDAAFGRGHNRELQARIVGTARHRRRDERRDPRRRVARARRWTPAAAGSTSAPPPSSSPSGAPRAIATYGDRVAVGLDVRGRTLAARGWTRDGGDLYDVLARLDGEGCARYVVTDVNKDGMLQGPNLDLLRDVCAATDRPVVASGGITELDDLARAAGAGRRRGRGRDHRHRALRGPVHPRGRPGADPAGTSGDARRPRHPVPRRRRRPGRQGRQLPVAARRRRPGRAGPALRRRGRRRADLPRHLRLPRGPRDHDGGRLALRRGGVHPADRRRRGRVGRRRRPAAPRGRRQGRRQHGRDPPARAGRRDRRPVRQPGAGALGRRPPVAGRHRLRASRSPPTAAASPPGSTRSRGRPGPRSSARARSCSTRWTPTAPPTASTSR